MEEFFRSQSKGSQVKTNIVLQYFDAWSQVIHNAQLRNPKMSSGRMAYFDLYAGPGLYEDGTKSTPLLIVEQAINSDFLREKLITVFNEGDVTRAKALEENILALDGIERLKYQPDINDARVDEKLVDFFREKDIVPALFFVDPFGYAGLTVDLIHAILRSWGCDCIFFFNYARVNAAINNDLVRTHVDAIFGHEKVSELRIVLPGLKPHERERVVMSTLNDVLKSSLIKYTRTFRFRRESKDETSHYLVFATKNDLAYKIMTDIMAKQSSFEIDGVCSFEYNPRDIQSKQSLVLKLFPPLDILQQKLLQDLAGQTLSTYAIFLTHSPGTTYRLKNYKDALSALYRAGKVEVGAKKPRGATFADDIVVTIPR